jgi:hypothetical protein
MPVTSVPRSHTSLVRDFLSEFRNRRVVYFANPGNAGDSVISCGMTQAMTEQNITWDMATLESDVTGRIVLIGGGGNLVPLYDNVAAAVRNFVGKAKLLVILPHTIAGHPEVLARLDETCVVFCRDAVSYHYMLTQTERCNFPEPVRMAEGQLHPATCRLLSHAHDARGGTRLAEVAVHWQVLPDRRGANEAVSAGRRRHLRAVHLWRLAGKCTSWRMGIPGGDPAG